MTAVRKKLMSVADFYDWAIEQPGRWELFEGEPVAMSPERVIHGDTIYRLARAVDDAVSKAGVPCRFIVDSAAVPISASSSYQPDLMICCGQSVSDDAVHVTDPTIVVEVLSPGNAIRDLRDKLQGYFLVPSINHYLIVDPDKEIIIQHQRGERDLVTRIVSAGLLRLNPPGIELELGAIFKTK